MDIGLILSWTWQSGLLTYFILVATQLKEANISDK